MAGPDEVAQSVLHKGVTEVADESMQAGSINEGDSTKGGLMVFIFQLFLFMSTIEDRG